jgi:SAM-dependent methyltransferase
MEFQGPRYLLSKRPHADELRAILWKSVKNGMKIRVARALRGRLRRGTEENREKYDRIAGQYYSPPVYDEPQLAVIKGRLVHAPGRVVRAAVVDELARHMADLDPKTVLEVGSGDGNNCPLLLERFPDLTFNGVDISPRRVEFARGRHKEFGARANWHVGSALSLPFADDSFDVVYSMYCLEQLPVEYKDAVREMMRVARKRVIFVEPLPEHAGLGQWLVALSRDFLRGLTAFLEESGYQIESVDPLASSLSPLNCCTAIVVNKHP